MIQPPSDSTLCGTSKPTSQNRNIQSLKRPINKERVVVRKSPLKIRCIFKHDELRVYHVTDDGLNLIVLLCISESLFQRCQRSMIPKFHNRSPLKLSCVLFLACLHGVALKIPSWALGNVWGSGGEIGRASCRERV